MCLGTDMTYEEYLDVVVRLTSQSVSPDTGMVTAAALGVLLRRAHPDEHWRSFGKRSLSELLRDLERQGRLRLVETNKGALAVAHGGLEPAPAPSTVVERFNPLRKSVWEAFVMATPRGRRFMDRESGAIRLALDVAPTPADDWIEIAPVGTERQRAWATEFLRSPENQGVSHLERRVHDADWLPTAFGRAIREADPVAGQKWNIFRSAKVSALVKEWLATNALPTDLAFQPSRSSEVSTERPTPARSVVDQVTDTRAVILAALATLPTEKLLEIPIPAGTILAALSNAKAS